MGTLNRDGVDLYYEETGSGDPLFLFIHGWCCNHTYFAPQIEHFAQEHRVVAVDLRGHGASDKPEQDYTIGGFAEDLGWMCTELGLHKPIVVGHSMGGVITWELAGRYANLPLAIVLVDSSAIIPPPGFRDALVPLIEGLRGEGYRETQRALIESMLFLPTDDAELKERVVAEMGSVPQRIMASAVTSLMLEWDGAAHGVVDVPTLMINAGESFSDMDRLRALCPNLQLGRTVGAGHFHQLLVPDQINPMIERFVECVASPA